MRISKVAGDWVVKGLHVHVGKVELMVRPGHGGSIVLKPVFRTTPVRELAAAVQQVKTELLNPVIRRRLHDAALRGLEFLRRSGLPGADAKAAELHFLAVALKRRGLR